MTFVHIDCGGPTYQIVVRGKVLPFELHHYHGPHPLHKVTSDPLQRIPPGFFEAFDLWQRGGKLLHDDVCVVPDECDKCGGDGDEIKHLGGKHYELIGRCKACKGKGVIHKRTNQ